MTTAELKQKVYGRHKAVESFLRRRGGEYVHVDGVSEWTVLEEWRQIDMIAFSAWSKRKRIGYELKVSRQDYRKELLNPGKRAYGREVCDEFYFVVPAGLLHPGEIEFTEPPEFTESSAFERTTCDERHPMTSGSRSYTDFCDRGKVRQRIRYEGPDGWPEYATAESCCLKCHGKGYLKKSLVERVAPTLWVPADVGLIEADGRGCVVTKPSPKKKPRDFDNREVTDLIRWASSCPDPRHATVHRHEGAKDG